MDDALLDQVQAGDAAARSQLLARFRAHLFRLVAERLDRRLTTRLDLSDVVQEILLDADRRLDAYLRQRPRPLPPEGWLSQLAGERIIDTHRRHLGAQCRDVRRERFGPEDRAGLDRDGLIQALISSQSSPSQHLMRSERVERLRATLAELAERDRQVLELRYLQQRDVASIAAALSLSESAVKARILRALLRLRDQLGDSD